MKRSDFLSGKNTSRSRAFLSLTNCRANASAIIKGSEKYACIKGAVKFYQTRFGTLVAAEVFGLPSNQNRCSNDIFGFHIHSGERCCGNDEDPFADAKSHYNPNNCDHPCHAGDLPPLFGNNGYAFSVFLTDRFSVDEVKGKTIIIHSDPDDFTTQPSGNSGEKMACGEIKSIIC